MIKLNDKIFLNIFKRSRMKKKSHRRRRDESQYDSSSSDSDESPKRPEDLYGELRSALSHNDRHLNRTIRNISKHYKNQVGILRITINGNFTFSQADIEDFFRRFGKIQHFRIKQASTKIVSDDTKNKEGESIAYIIYADYFSAVLALKILSTLPEKERIVKAKICTLNPHEQDEKLSAEPTLLSNSIDDMILTVEKDKEFDHAIDGYKYVGTIGLDLYDSRFRLKERILGVEGCNFIRIYYLCERSFKFENEGDESKEDDLKLKLVINKETGSDREVLILSHSLQKYNEAIRFLHQLMEQIIQQYKNSREKSTQIIAKDIHIKRWEKFTCQPQLKFLT